MLHKCYIIIATFVLLYTPLSVKSQEASKALTLGSDTASTMPLHAQPDSSLGEKYRDHIIPLYSCVWHPSTTPPSVKHFDKTARFSKLPLGRIRCITEYLDPLSMLNLRGVSKAWNQYIHWLLNQEPNILNSMTGRLLSKADQPRYAPDNFFELTLNTALRFDFSKSMISEYSKELTINNPSPYRGKVHLPLDCQKSTRDILFGQFSQQLPGDFSLNVISSLLRTPSEQKDVISRALTYIFLESKIKIFPSLLKGYQDTITLPPVFETLTIDIPSTAAADPDPYCMDLIDCAFKFFHPGCNFNTLEISYRLFASFTCFQILESALANTTLKTVQKIKKLRISIDHQLEDQGLNTPPYIGSDNLKRFVNLFENVELDIIYSRKPSQNEKSLRSPQLNFLKAFGNKATHDNISNHQNLSIFLHYPHITDAHSSEYCIDLSDLYLIPHSLKNIQVISKIPPAAEFISVLKEHRASQPRLKNLQKLTFSHPDGTEIQKLQWD